MKSTSLQIRFFFLQMAVAFFFLRVSLDFRKNNKNFSFIEVSLPVKSMGSCVSPNERETIELQSNRDDKRSLRLWDYENDFLSLRNPSLKTPGSDQ